jgi:hypothetical protein
MKITKRRLRKILIESLLFESRKTREWIKTQPAADQEPLLDAYNKGLTVIDQLSWIQKVRGTEPIQDVVPDVIRFYDPQVQAIIRENGFQTNLNRRTYPSVGELRRVIRQVDALIDSRKEATSTQQTNPIDDPHHVDKIAKVGPWTILMPRTVTGSISCDISGNDTSWCTTKSRGQNLFLSYVGRGSDDIILFYVMDYSRTPDDPHKSQQEACVENNDSRLSIGFINGEPVLKGQSGGLSVDAANMGLNKRILRSSNGLGQYYDQIMGILSAEAQAIGSTHPAKESLKRARKDLLYLKSVIKDYDKDAKKDYLRQVTDDLSESPSEVIEFILFSDTDTFYDIIRSRGENSQNVNFSQDILEKIYNEFSTKRMDIGKIFTQYQGGSRFSSDMLIFDVLTFKSYLMSEEMFDRFFDLYNDLLDERLIRTGQMRQGTVIDSSVRMDHLVETILSFGHRRGFQIHPKVAQKIQERHTYQLSDEGIQDLIDQDKQNEIRTIYNLASKDIKEKFYESGVSTRFEHALRTFRYIIEEGRSKFTEYGGFEGLDVPPLDQRDGIALSIVQQELIAGRASFVSWDSGLQPKLVQDVEMTFTSVFPEFYQMKPSQFKNFIKGGNRGLNNLMISQYVKDSGLDWLFGFGHNRWTASRDITFFNSLIDRLLASPFISEKMANYVKRNMCVDFSGFLRNPKYSTDQYLVDLYRVLRYHSTSEGPQLSDTQYTRTIGDDDKGYFGDLVYAEIEDRAFNAYPTTWTLGEEILEELNIEPGDY